MSRPFIKIKSPPIAFDIPTGGYFAVLGEEVEIPVTVACTDTGVGVGPVHVGVPEGDHATVNRVDFTSDEDDDGGWFSLSVAGGSAGAAATAPRRGTEDEGSDPPNATRRSVIGAAAGLVTAGFVGVSSVAAEEELVTLTLAEFEFTEVSGPIHVSVLDIVDEVLPQTTDLIVDVDGARTGEFAEPGVGTTIAAEAAAKGPIRVYLRDSVGKLAQLLAWARGALPGSADVTYTRTFPDGTKASDYSEGEFVRLTEHPSIVEPVVENDPKETKLVVGSTRIPHEGDGVDGVGAWSVFSDSLIYEVGPDPPAASDYEITIGLGIIEQILER